MSQAQMPSVPINRFIGWADEDFYRLKLVCDRVDRRGFWYYLFHPSHALRDFTLWLRFKDIIKPKKTLLLRAQRPKFNWLKKRKKQKIEEEKENKDFNKTQEHSAPSSVMEKEVSKQFDKSFFVVEKLTDKIKMRKCYDVALEMQQKGLIANTKEALDAQVNQMLKFDVEALKSFEEVIKKTDTRKE